MTLPILSRCILVTHIRAMIRVLSDQVRIEPTLARLMLYGGHLGSTSSSARSTSSTSNTATVATRITTAAIATSAAIGRTTESNARLLLIIVTIRAQSHADEALQQFVLTTQYS